MNASDKDTSQRGQMSGSTGEMERNGQNAGKSATRAAGSLTSAHISAPSRTSRTGPSSSASSARVRSRSASSSLSARGSGSS